MAKKHHAKHHGKGGHHTGKIVHPDMTSLLGAHTGKDQHASAEYHARNKEHGMPEGLHNDGDESGEHEGGEGMAGNACCE